MGINEATNKKWLEQCKESLKNEPIKLHQLQSIPNKEGLFRAEAYKKGKNKYVSLVDPDDYIKPGIFNKLLSIMETGKYSAAYSNHEIINSRGNKLNYNWFNKPETKPSFKKVRQMHHIVIFDRKIFDSEFFKILSKVKGGSNRSSSYIISGLQAMTSGKVYCLNEIGYYWRIHENNTHKKLLKPEPEVERWIAKKKIQLYRKNKSI